MENKMIGLDSVLKDLGVDSNSFENILADLDVEDSDIKKAQEEIAEIIKNTLVNAGNTVVEDYE